VAGLDPRRTALVLIDLQKGIVGRPLQPRSGEAVVSTASDLARRFRAAGAPVVLVHVGFASDYADAPPQAVDQPMPRPPGGFPPEFSELVPGLEQAGDIVVRKRQWGAFYGTDLDLQLRRRGVGTIVLGGIATNIGVESTARAAWEHGYDLIVAEDACATSLTAEAHAFSILHILPRLGRVVQSRDIKAAT
jgi:nicotinamidase-related amidase